jgi:class 3 adenylate cyclase
VVVAGLPPVRYVDIGDESIAYRDFEGDGLPLVYLGTSGNHQDMVWEEPGYAHMLRSLAALGRLVTYDRRGSGLSSRTVKPTLETRIGDVVAVLDGIGLEHAALVASSGSTGTALAFAAMQPDRTRALVLYAAAARTSAAPDYEIGIAADVTRGMVDATESVWGTGITAQLYAPSMVSDAGFLEWTARYERALTTPREARQWVEMYSETDVRDALPLVQAPALIVTPALASNPAPLWSHYVADHLADAVAVDIPARDHWPFGDGMDAFLQATAEFVTRVAGFQTVRRADRRLAAVLFTDLVASTEHLRSAGDRKWHATLDSHDDLAQRAVTRHGGRLVKSTGDGILAVFDGPASAVVAAAEILHAVSRLGLAARAGVHVGELEERGDDVSGIAVTLCSRIADQAAAGETLVSSTVRDLVAGSGLVFEARGAHHLKGIDEPVSLLAASVR